MSAEYFNVNYRSNFDACIQFLLTINARQSIQDDFEVNLYSNSGNAPDIITSRS